MCLNGFTATTQHLARARTDPTPIKGTAICSCKIFFLPCISPTVENLFFAFESCNSIYIAHLDSKHSAPGNDPYFMLSIASHPKQDLIDSARTYEL